MMTSRKIIFYFICMCLSMLFLLPSNAFSGTEWKRYQLKNGNFSVMFPHAPTEKTYAVTMNGVDADGYQYQACLNNCSIAYTIYFADFGIDASIGESSQTTLDNIAKRVVKSIGGNLLLQKVISYKGYQARDLKISVDSHEGQMIIYHRVFLVGNKVYSLIVATPQLYESMPDHFQFLDSVSFESQSKNIPQQSKLSKFLDNLNKHEAIQGKKQQHLINLYNGVNKKYLDKKYIDQLFQYENGQISILGDKGHILYGNFSFLTTGSRLDIVNLLNRSATVHIFFYGENGNYVECLGDKVQPLSVDTIDFLCPDRHQKKYLGTIAKYGVHLKESGLGNEQLSLDDQINLLQNHFQ